MVSSPNSHPKNGSIEAHAPSKRSALEGRVELVASVESPRSRVPPWAPSSEMPRGPCSHLGVLRGDLQHESQAVVVEVLIEGQERPVHAALHQVVGVLAEPDGLDPVNDLVVGPHQHVCERARARLRASSDHALPCAGT